MPNTDIGIGYLYITSIKKLKYEDVCVHPHLLLVCLADSVVLGSHRVLEGLPQTGERDLTRV